MSDRGESQRRWWPWPLHLSKELQQEADRRAGESLASLLDDAGKSEVKALLASGKFVPAVRRVRELAVLGVASFTRGESRYAELNTGSNYLEGLMGG